ncbi:hypothetical protein IV203_012580 [Nitzschia inconspicua]|uniref:Uncharacterized protein n=1 Tax=Nitzschia inconspicua TaxID=303405 RepID=A0A9K3KVS2_9STRA|nr:hypothetical protein IV203_012580 [Nitzschia inconspicua]
MPCNSNRNSSDRQRSALSPGERLPPRAWMAETPEPNSILNHHFFNSSSRHQNYRAVQSRLAAFSLPLHPLTSSILPSDPTVIDILDAAIDIVNKDFGLGDEDSDSHGQNATNK